MVDVFDAFDHEDGRSLLASFGERGQAMAQAIAAARSAGVPVIYVNDAHGWDSDARRVVGTALDGDGGDVIAPLRPEDGDPILLKHRYSAFDHTALDLLLESLDVARVLIVGAATEGCVVQTAIDARERGLKASIVVDACATTHPDLESVALRYVEDVGGVRLEHRVTTAPFAGASEG